MGEPGNDKRDALQALLEEEGIQKDIGVANYLISTYADGASLPGDLLNWAARFDIEEMVNAKVKLQALAKEYSYVSDPEHRKPLDAAWDGEGANAFIERWNNLATYLSGEDDIHGLLYYLQKFTDDLDDLAQGARNFQGDCIDAVDEKLRGLRKKYCEALAAYGNGEGDSAGDTFSSYAGTGAGVGAVGGAWGAAIGSLLGGLVGVVNGFNDHVSTGAEKELGRVDTAQEFEDELQNKEESFTGAIGGDSTYSRGGGSITEYDPTSDDGEMDGKWDPS